MKKIKGFTLIEMLCALSISIIIMATVLEVFLGYKTSFKINQAFSEIQENARFASHILTLEISQAGYIGCAKLSENLPVINLGVDSPLFYYNTLGVYDDSNWRLHLSSTFNLKPKVGSNIIVVRKMSSHAGSVLEEVENSDRVRVSLEPKFEKGDEVVISDCSNVYFAKIYNVYRSEKNKFQQLALSGKLEKKFSLGAQVGKLVTKVFAVQATSRKNSNGDKIYALYEFDRGGRKTELVAGVFDMKVSCFEKRSSGGIFEVSSKAVVNWPAVKMLKIVLLFRSVNDVLIQTKPYYFDDMQTLPADKRLYRAITFYIPIRG